MITLRSTYVFQFLVGGNLFGLEHSTKFGSNVTLPPTAYQNLCLPKSYLLISIIRDHIQNSAEISKILGKFWSHKMADHL